MSTDDYTAQVVASLRARGGDPELSPADKALIEMGRFYRVGPVDCSYQIMSDRADPRNLRRRTG